MSYKARSFSSNVHYGPTCWEWMGGKDSDGYGIVRANGRSVRAHRLSYETRVGSIPHGNMVLHSCDNPSCIRHDHLFLGNALANMQDKCSKGRHSNSQKTHCKFGHEYSQDNTHICVNGARKCRKCDAVRAQENRRVNR